MADLVLTFECAAHAAFVQEVVQVPLEVVAFDAPVGQWQRQRQGPCADAIRVQGGGVVAQTQPAVAELLELAESLPAEPHVQDARHDVTLTWEQRGTTMSSYPQAVRASRTVPVVVGLPFYIREMVGREEPIVRARSVWLCPAVARTACRARPRASVLRAR